jgi:hypothetical protein
LDTLASGGVEVAGADATFLAGSTTFSGVEVASVDGVTTGESVFGSRLGTSMDGRVRVGTTESVEEAVRSAVGACGAGEGLQSAAIKMPRRRAATIPR